MSNATQSLAGKRITSLLDANSFVEIGQSVTARSTDFNSAEKKAPSDGVITGYGVIDGDLVYVYSQDVSVLNGTVGEMHAKKITRLYDLAMKTGAPVIGLIDCAGLRLQEATDALEAFGEIYFKQTLASGVIPQITGIFGTCGGGMAVVPALTDFTFIESKKGKMFVNSPNALEGNHIDKCDTSDAAFQSRETGLIDGVGTEDEILEKIRELVRRERTIELANEGFRRPDIVRWKDANGQLVAKSVMKPIYRMIGTIDYNEPDPTKRFVQTLPTPENEGARYIEDRSFQDFQRYLPLRQSELDKNPNLTQTPGY